MDTNEPNIFLDSVLYQLRYYKNLAEKAIDQLDDSQLHLSENESSLNIATLFKHLPSNMLSRWTDFLTTDGEKDWRQREDEFIDTIKTRTELIDFWNKGWKCLLNAINSLSIGDLEKTVYIRNEGFTVIEAIHRGFAHVVYHVGQIVYIAKKLKEDNWESLSIPKGGTKEYNKEKFNKPKARKTLI